jgi:NAD(P)H-flavin reductase
MIGSRLAGGGLKPRTVLLNGVSYVRDIGYAARLEGWRRTGAYPVAFVPTVSRPRDPANDGWTGRTGRVESILPDVLDGLGVAREEVVASLCGNPDMILAAEAILLERGFTPEQVRKELYWPKGKAPTGPAGVAGAHAGTHAGRP